MKELIKEMLRKRLLNEVRVINPDIVSMTNEPPLRDNDTIRVYHGFNDYEEAITAAKFGFSGQEKAKRIYSFEANNNPNGLFVTLDFNTALKFTYPRSKNGIIVIMELNVKVSNLEAPVWPGGHYTVQGQMSQSWKDEKDRYEQGTLMARQDARNNEIPFISDSDRPELAATLYGPERQALLVGDINPNMISKIFYGSSGKHAMRPKKLERLTRKEFLNKFENYKYEKNGNTLSNAEYDYYKKKDRLFGPNDDFNLDKFNAKTKEYDKTGIELLKYLDKHNHLSSFIWPKQIKQVKDILYNLDNNEM